MRAITAAVSLAAACVVVSPALAAAQTPAAPPAAVGGGLDCNGYSPTSGNSKVTMICADRKNTNGGRFWDNGWYVGHDEPSIQWASNVAGSANSMVWIVALPGGDPVPTQSGTSVANFELYPAFWMSLALCDPNSWPFNPCIPNSDANSSNILTGAGSAVLELQFYPPGWPPFNRQISCSPTQWCAALNVDSATVNSACMEPVNFAFLQTDGVPAGPPAPGQQTVATMTPNAKTLMMNPGDLLVVIVSDTSAGLITYVKDVTTNQAGFMIAGSSSGFANTNPNTCQTTPFSFHPEYSTAAPANIVPWAALQLNVNFAVETGHFELGSNGDADADDAPCFNGPLVSGCLAFATSGDSDFDGPPYQPDWPDGSANHPKPLAILSGPITLTSAGLGSVFPTMQFETNVGYTETGCNPFTGAGCTVPPTGAAFYPFYSRAGAGAPCVLTFGNDIPGVTTNDFGKDAQYGTSNPTQPALFNSGFIQNPCTP